MGGGRRVSGRFVADAVRRGGVMSVAPIGVGQGEGSCGSEPLLSALALTIADVMAF
jgi:hypothetical protein